MKKVWLLFLLPFAFQSRGQEALRDFSLQTGPVMNTSAAEINNTTGPGIFVQANYEFHEKFRLGLRVEPVALADGILTLDGGGCGTGCKEGANALVNNYLKGEYLLGRPKYGAKGGKYQAYIGVSLLLLTHRRHVIIRRVDQRENIRKRITNVGIGTQLGVILGKIDLSISYNSVGSEFGNYLGLSLGYYLFDQISGKSNSSG